MTDDLIVIIPYYNGQATIERLLDSLPDSLPVLIVDDLSDEPYQPTHPNVTAIRPSTKGYFTGAVNRGLEATTGDVLILNQDVWFKAGGWSEWLNELRRDYDLVGDAVKGHPAWPAGYIQGTFMYISRRVIEAIGPMNEADYPLWGSTCEYQLRACRRGFKALPWPSAGRWLGHQDRPRGKYGSAITEVLADEPTRKAEFIRTPPAVSVIVPCYNYGRYLADCVASLIGGETSLGPHPGQSFQSFEVIIIDDASQDETPTVGAALVDSLKGIRYIRLNENRGTPGAINAGIEAAFGKYITVLSADDMRESWSLEALYRLCEADPHAVAYDDMMVFRHGKRVGPVAMLDYNFEAMLYKNPMHAGIMYPKAAWQAVGGYPLQMKYGREDWAFNVALGLKGYCGKRIARPGYLYRREKQNRTLRNTGRDWRERFLRQMQTIYKETYEGWRPPMCCGRDSAIKSQSVNGGGNGAMVMAQQLTGASGLVLIEYIGRNWGDETWQPDQKSRYTFGGIRKQGYIDRKHVEWFLSRRDSGGPLFRVAVTPEPVAISQAEAEAVNPGAGQAVVIGVDTLAVPDPADYSIRELRALTLSADEWKLMLEKEEQGQGRKSAIAYMEAQLG